MQVQLVTGVAGDTGQHCTAIHIQAHQNMGLIISPGFADDGGLQAVENAAVLTGIQAQADIAGLYL